MEKNFCIYKHENLITGGIYIGQTCQAVERRWRDQGKGYVDSPKFWNAIQKYGWDNFSHEILEENLTQEEADEREKYWIKYYNSFEGENGYNLTPGGNDYHAELWADPEYREKMSKRFSEVRRQKWHNDKDYAEKTLAQLIDGIHKAWNDEEWRAKRIANITGSKNPNSKAVINIETGREFSTIKEASEWIGHKSVSGIGECCKGNRKTCGKHPETHEPLHWKYKDDVSSDEEVLKRCQNQTKIKVVCINTNEVFESLSAAARWCGLFDSGKSIKACCVNKQMTAGFLPGTNERLKWRFAEGGDIKEDEGI